MRVLATITYTCILEHLVSNFREQRRLFDDTIYDLGIGTYGEDVVVAYPHQTLHEVLHTLHLHGLSAVPVIDENTKNQGGLLEERHHVSDEGERCGRCRIELEFDAGCSHGTAENGCYDAGCIAHVFDATHATVRVRILCTMEV